MQVFIHGSEHIPPQPEKIPDLMMYYIYNIIIMGKIFLVKSLDTILNLKKFILLEMIMIEQADYF